MARLIVRDHYLEMLTKIKGPALVRIITGVRRCGKSALLQLYRDYLIESGVKPQEILVINFEDAANDYLRDPQVFHKYVREQQAATGIRYLHVDEVQELGEWSRIINSLRLPENLEICVTGSNASMFSGELVTYLAGRYIELPMLPLSLGEFQRFRAAAGVPNLGVNREYQDLMRIGGFPASALVKNLEVVRQLNSALFDSIFTRDISLRGQIRDTETFLRVARFVFDNVGKPLSTHSIVKNLKANGTNVSAEMVERYLGLMEDAHLFYRCRRYDTQGKQWLRTNGKFYYVDPGLRNALLGQRDFNHGRDLENMVYLELRRRGCQVMTGAVPQGEIDFIVTRGQQQIFIQVAYSTENDETLVRELAPFKYAPAGTRCVLITLDRLQPATGAIEWVDALEFLSGHRLD